MEWLGNNECCKQIYHTLRLYAPDNEKILLDFNPVRMSSLYSPSWEDWHCYPAPLRIYRQDYEHLIVYFNKIFPLKDAFSGETKSYLDICFDNWIEKNDWYALIKEIQKDIPLFTDDEIRFYSKFTEWLNEALDHTDVIVVEGNL